MRDTIDINSREVNVVRINLTNFNNLFNFYNGEFSCYSAVRIKITCGFTED